MSDTDWGPLNRDMDDGDSNEEEMASFACRPDRTPPTTTETAKRYDSCAFKTRELMNLRQQTLTPETVMQAPNSGTAISKTVEPPDGGEWAAYHEPPE